METGTYYVEPDHEEECYVVKQYEAINDDGEKLNAVIARIYLAPDAGRELAKIIAATLNGFHKMNASAAE